MMNVESDIKAIKAHYTEMEEACDKGDAKMLVRGYGPDTLYISSNTPILVGPEPVEMRYGERFASHRINAKWSVDEVEISGDLAYARTICSISETPLEGGEITQRYVRSLDIFRRQSNGVWKIARNMLASAPSP